MDICKSCCDNRGATTYATESQSLGRCVLCGKIAVLLDIPKYNIPCLHGNEELSAAPNQEEMVAILRADFENQPDWRAGELLELYVNQHVAAALSTAQQYVDHAIEKAIETHEDNGALHELPEDW